MSLANDKMVFSVNDAGEPCIKVKCPQCGTIQKHPVLDEGLHVAFTGRSVQFEFTCNCGAVRKALVSIDITEVC